MGFRKKSTSDKLPNSKSDDDSSQEQDLLLVNQEKGQRQEKRDSNHRMDDSASGINSYLNEDDLDRIERASPVSMDVERGKLKLHLLKDYDTPTNLSASSSGSNFLIGSRGANLHHKVRKIIKFIAFIFAISKRYKSEDNLFRRQPIRIL